MLKSIVAIAFAVALVACGADPCNGLPCGATCCVEHAPPQKVINYLPCQKNGQCDRHGTCVDTTQMQAPVCQ
jgi:hypothetical protein